MVRLKSAEEIQGVEIAAKIVAEILEALDKLVCEGSSAYELEKFAADFINRKGGIPAFKGYGDYPYVLCVSVNEEIVHGFPLKNKVFAAGDLVSVDCGVILNNYFGDAAKTYVVGDYKSEADRLLVKATEESLYKGIEVAYPGNRIGDIGYAVQKHVEAYGFSVIRDYVGHGVGIKLHEDPQVPNYGRKGTGTLLRPGMILAIEPMVAQGAFDVCVLDDGWTAVTADRSKAAHFEHDIVIEKDGPRILSKL